MARDYFGAAAALAALAGVSEIIFATAGPLPRRVGKAKILDGDPPLSPRRRLQIDRFKAQCAARRETRIHRK